MWVLINKNCVILTINNVDDPLPFFSETGREYVRYKSKKGNNITHVVHVLKPDVEHNSKIVSS